MEEEPRDGKSKSKDDKSDRTCRDCNKVFKTRFHLNRHRLIHTGEKPFECAKCNKRFIQKTTLNIHMLKHLGNRPYQCRKCGQRFSQKGNLTAHIKRLHSNFLREGQTPKFSCSQCTCQFKKLASLNGHVTRVHSLVKKVKEDDGDEVTTVQKVLEQINALNDQPNFVVPAPPQKQPSVTQEKIDDRVVVTIPDNFVEITDFDGRKYRVEYRRDENGRRLLLCYICEKPFYRPSDLLRHRRIHTDERPFVCEKCRAGFRTKNSLKAHLKTHEKTPPATKNASERTQPQLNQIEEELNLPPTEPSLTYKVVGYILDQPEQQQIVFLDSLENAEIPPEASLIYKQVDDYIPSMENSEQVLICDLQASNFIQTEHFLPQPIEVLTENVTHEVPQQPKVFTNLTQLAENAEIHVEGTNLTVCQKEIVSEPRLEPVITIKNVENEAKLDEKKRPRANYTCQYCSKSFRRPTDLQRHVRTHTNEKPYKCTECEKAFALKATLLFHLKTHQTDREKVSCLICDKKFTSTVALNVHKRIHNNLLPYKCQYCEKRVRNSSNLRKHERVHVKIAEKTGKRPEDVRPRTTKFSQLLKYLEASQVVEGVTENKSKSYEIVIRMESANDKKEQKRFLCPYQNCSKEFSKPSLLERHKFVHTKVKNFICDICGSRFNQKASIGVHMISHTNLYQFQCKYCPRKFKFKSGRSEHQERCSKKKK
ncbi:zinc finger protein 236-like [Culicoides brevitarsis]|uniref:zinc finger protein 236-like n=1 Tax=Culicoides brevitarsis TaxID=469753 RepID=UPI00307CA307